MLCLYIGVHFLVVVGRRAGFSTASCTSGNLLVANERSVLVSDLRFSVGIALIFLPDQIVLLLVGIRSGARNTLGLRNLMLGVQHELVLGLELLQMLLRRQVVGI